MPGQRCCVCGSNQKSDTTVKFHHFPSDTVTRKRSLEIFDMQESDLKPSSRVCSRHFPDGNTKKEPSMVVGQ